MGKDIIDRGGRRFYREDPRFSIEGGIFERPLTDIGLTRAIITRSMLRWCVTFYYTVLGEKKKNGFTWLILIFIDVKLLWHQIIQNEIVSEMWLVTRCTKRFEVWYNCAMAWKI